MRRGKGGAQIMGARVRAIGLGLMATLLTSAPVVRSAPADLILVNAAVWTSDPARPGAQAVAGDRILALGGESEVARLDALSQVQTPRLDVERSYTNLDLFRDHQMEGSLSLGVYAMLLLGGWRDYPRFGIRPGAFEVRIRFGALKTFMDASFMERPFSMLRAGEGV